MQYLAFLATISGDVIYQHFQSKKSVASISNQSNKKHLNVTATKTENAPFALTKAEAFNASKLNKSGVSFVIAIVIISMFLWFCVLTPLHWKVAEHHYLTSFLLIILQMYLFTGIFITAHDAMHGLILPRSPLINKYVGIVCVELYAFFDYNLLLDAHNDHHAHSGELHRDPDYHEYDYDAEWKTIIVWFGGFMKEYGSLKPVILRSLLYNTLTLYFGFSHLELNLFWSLPSILSAFQLWYFGTYLVHRQCHGNLNGNVSENEHNAYTDYSKSIWYHLFTCFCFGVHYEHHKYPYLPWWYLPTVYQQRNN